jgi:putative transposase
MTYVFIARRCDDLPVTVCCRTMKVSTSGYYAWQAHPVSGRDLDDAILTNHIYDIHVLSRRSYGSPRVHAELRLGDLALRCGRKRVERGMRQAGIVGIHRRKRHGCTVRDRKAVPSDDLVNRQFSIEAPDKLWVMDVTEHPTGTGKVYLATVIDAWSRSPPLSTGDPERLSTGRHPQRPSTSYYNQLEQAVLLWPVEPEQYTSWAFGRRLRAAGLLGSMGSIGDAYDNSMAESFFGTLQLELLDERAWPDHDTLAQAIFEWIEPGTTPPDATSIGMLSPNDYEQAHTPARQVA